MTIRVKIINESTVEENTHLLVSNIKILKNNSFEYEVGQAYLGPGTESEFYVYDGRELIITEISNDELLKIISK